MNEQFEQPALKVVDENAANEKWVFPAILFLFALCILIGCLHFFYANKYLRISQLSTLLLLGCFYVAFIQSRLATTDDRSAFAIFLCVGFPIALIGVYIFRQRPDLFLAVSFGACFSLPIVIMEAWRTFNISQSGIKGVWYYSKDIPPEPMFVYLENKKVRFRILAENQSPVVIDSIVPFQLQIGLMFFYMLKEKDVVQKMKKYFVDERGDAYGWIFYTSKFGMKEYLNPYENLFQYKIKSNTLIVAKQIKSN